MPSRLPTLVTGVAAALPVIVSTGRALAEGWVPFGDQATVLVRAYDVFSSHMPLLGQYSDSSQVTGRVTHSPGPLLYWLLAPAAHLGSGAAVVVTIGLLNTAAVVGAVGLARRRGGAPLMIVVALALALMCRSFVPETLHDPWNPSAAVLPFTLLIFICWSIATGEAGLLPPAVLLASFVVQCHLAYVVPTAVLLLVAVAGLISARPGGSRRWVLVALVTGVICWLGPIVDQLTRKPGNIVLLGRIALAHEPKVGFAVGWHALVRAVGAVPWWLRIPPNQFYLASDVRTTGGVFASVSCLAILALLAVVAVAGVRRRRADLAAAGAVGLGLCAALVLITAATPTKPVLMASLGYTLWWGSPAGMFVWIVTGWGVWTLTRERERLRVLSWEAPRWAPAALGMIAAAATGGAVAAGQRPDEHVALYRPIRVIARALAIAVPAARTVWLDGGGGATVPVKPGITYALRSRGMRVLGLGATPRLDEWYGLDHRGWDYGVYITPGTTAPASRGRVVAGVSVDGKPVAVAVSRARG